MKSLQEVSDATIQKAVEIRCSECFVAMLYANAFAGNQNETWDVIHNYKLSELIEEVQARNLPISDWYASVDTENRKVVDTPAYQKWMPPPPYARYTA